MANKFSLDITTTFGPAVLVIKDPENGFVAWQSANVDDRKYHAVVPVVYEAGKWTGNDIDAEITSDQVMNFNRQHFDRLLHDAEYQFSLLSPAQLKSAHLSNLKAELDDINRTIEHLQERAFKCKAEITALEVFSK